MITRLEEILKKLSKNTEQKEEVYPKVLLKDRIEVIEEKIKCHYNPCPVLAFKKDLFQCDYCEEFFCKKHRYPKLTKVGISEDKSDYGHPDANFSEEEARRTEQQMHTHIKDGVTSYER